MATHEIGRDAWASYFEEFTRTHQNARVTVETVDAQADPQISPKDKPFTGISYANQGDGEIIELLLGGEKAHAITAPKHVYHKTGAGIISDEVNSDEILEITSAGHPAITLLQFHPAKE
jgi:hypothetical protein